jgi:uncharacterized membrane protein YecN with MAPEG domain
LEAGNGFDKSILHMDKTNTESLPMFLQKEIRSQGNIIEYGIPIGLEGIS